MTKPPLALLLTITAAVACSKKQSPSPPECTPACTGNAICTNHQCVVQAPAVNSVSAPTTWSKRSQTVPVTAVIDGTGGPGIASATLQIAGQPDIAGTTTDSGLIRTYTFAVPGTVQTAFSETPVDFTIVAADTGGHTTPAAAQGHGQLLIDDVGPAVAGVTVNGGVAVAGIKWFKQGAGNIDAQVAIADAGSGVDPATLTLVSGGARIDAGTPTCTTGAAITCHFSVPQSAAVVPAGAQRLVSFTVAGADKAGNAVKSNIAALGIDGKPPQVTLTIGDAGTTGKTSNYPAKNADCGAPLDATLYCGHDGSHFLRAGDGKYKVTFTVTDAFAAPDDKGSGVDPAGGSCSISGSTTSCTATFDSTASSFSFGADFATATMTTAADGTGTVTVNVNAKDAVGNTLAAPVSATIQVTRVKWMRALATVNNLAGAPLLSAAAKQIIVAGNSTSADPIVSLGTDGSLGAFKFGAGKFASITTNMALDTTPSTDSAHPTPALYATAGLNLYAVSTADATQYCQAALSASAITGAPVLFGGGATADVIVTSANKIGAFTTSFASHSCVPDGSTSFTNATAPQPTLGPPSANGNTIYFGYDNTANTAGDRGLKSVQFSAGAFSNANSSNIGKNPTISGNVAAPVTPASDVFFGNEFNHFIYDYTTSFALAHTSPQLAGALFAQPLVSRGLVFGVSDSLLAFNASDISSVAWTALNGGTHVSPPAIGTDTLYASEGTNNEMHAIDPTTVPSGAPTTRADRWVYAGSASTSPITTLSSVTTEPTLAPDAVLYFGDNAGKIYALITDTPPATTGTSDWPRTGYDNCNSNHAGNTGFVCQ